MTILDKLKNIIPLKRRAEDENAKLNYIILNRLFTETKTLNNKPHDLSEEEWSREIKSMIFSFRTAKSNIYLRSPTRKRERELRIQKGFNSFIKYYNQL
jgi:hypothetical protein